MTRCDKSVLNRHESTNSMMISDLDFGEENMFIRITCPRDICPFASFVYIVNIRTTYPCDLYPLAPHFYIVKLGLRGYTIFSHFYSKT